MVYPTKNNTVYIFFMWQKFNQITSSTLIDDKNKRTEVSPTTEIPISSSTTSDVDSTTTYIQTGMWINLKI